MALKKSNRKKSKHRILHPRNSMTKEEEEKGIIEMFKAGYTFPEIATQKHKSVTTIKEITDRYESSMLPKEKTRASEAYRLFKERKNCLEVAIELGLTASETKKYFEEFIELSQIDEFNKVYSEVGSDLQLVVSFYKDLKGRGIKIEQIPAIQELASEVTSLTRERGHLSIERDKISQVVVDLSSQSTQCQNAINGL
jgi:hypothetical protein